MTHRILVFCLAMALLSCNKVLDEPYDQRVTLKTIADYRALLSQAYPERQDLFTDILTDDYHHYGGTMQASLTAVYVPLYLWQDNYTEGTATPSAAYAHYYNKIYLVNNVIAEVMDAEGENAAKEALLAEALMVRAYSYFSLVNLFAKHFDAATAATDLGVPLILDVPTANRPTFHRATVARVYQQLEKDMQQGLSLMERHPTLLSKNPYHFSLPSVYAFFSRFHLYQKEYEKCITASEKGLALSGGVLRDLAADVAILKSYDIAYFAQEFMNPTSHRNILLASQSNAFLTRPTGFRLSGFYPTHQLYYNFPKTDLRYQLFSAGGTVIDSVTNYVKYAQQPNQPNVGVSRYECFTNEELLLNLAEAKLRQATPDLVGAMVELERIRMKRLVPYTALNSGGISVANAINLVMDERRKEFLGQGMRWFDIKRLGISVQHKLVRSLGKIDATLQANDLRKALQIPVSARIGNPVLENELNPR